MRSAAIGGEVDVESPPFVHNTAGYLNTAKPQSSPQDIQRAIDILSQSRRPWWWLATGYTSPTATTVSKS